MSLIDEQDRRDAELMEWSEIIAGERLREIENLLDAHWNIYCDEAHELVCWALEEEIYERYWELPPATKVELKKQWPWLDVAEAKGPPG